MHYNVYIKHKHKKNSNGYKTGLPKSKIETKKIVSLTSAAVFNCNDSILTLHKLIPKIILI